MTAEAVALRPLPGAGPAAALDQERAPLAELLDEELPRSTRWSVPGHLGGRAAPARALDLLGATVHAADLWPDQRRYATALGTAELLAADAWGAARAHLLTGGATSGNLAWVLGTLAPGDTVVLDSACHVSVLTALRLSPGVRPVWVQRTLDPVLGLPQPLDPALLAQALRENPDARQVVVTSPTYSGTGSDLRGLAEVTRRAGVVLYVDAAWAPHGRWVAGAHLDPLAAGADGCVVSLHKTGSALSGAAVLLTAAGPSPALENRVASTVEGLRSTSPLLPVLVSSDLARSALATASPTQRGDAATLAADLRRRCAAVSGIRVVDGSELTGGDAGLSDPLKLVLDVSATGHTGFVVQRRLRDEGVIVEGADLDRLYLVLPAIVDDGTPVRRDHARAHRTVSEALARAVAGASSHGSRWALNPSVWASSRGSQVLLPSEAARRPQQRVPLAQAAGRVAAEHAAPYPPGVPVLVPGEVVTAEAVAILGDVLHHGGEVHGPADGCGRTIAVVDEEQPRQRGANVQRMVCR